MSLNSISTRLLLCLGVALVSAPARAVPQFPRTIASQLQLSYDPPCSVCHLGNKTSSVTVTTPFGYALRERGLSGRQSLPGALTRLADDHADSDGDGAADTVELKNGTDPNSRVNASLVDVADPNFGCSTARPGRETSALLALLLGVTGAAVGVRRRAQRGRASSAAG
ncbi:MAG TPA: thrombospondin type 3 repeat-containing protein [Polyangiaceae bacterium]|nr:thrombospondin type 3 repeat-containing protein [Polyangiaceae bacterium]